MMGVLSGTISRGGLISWFRYVNSTIDYLRPKVYGSKCLIVKKAVVNGKEVKPGVVKSERIQEFVAMLTTKRKYAMEFELGVDVIDVVRAPSLIFGEHEEKVLSYLRFLVACDVQGSEARYTIESKVVVDQSLPKDRIGYLKDFFDRAETKSANMVKDIVRKELISSLMHEITQRARANFVSTVARFSEVDKKDLEALLAFLYVARGVPPDMRGIFSISGKKTLRELYSAVKSRLGKAGLVAPVDIDITVRDAWGFGPDVDFALSKKGVRVLSFLIGDDEILRKVLEARLLGEGWHMGEQVK
jgi:hypothetical protein